MTDDDFDQQSPIGNYLATASDLYAYALDLRNQKKIMSDSLQYIIDMGFDYDGYHSAEDLKGLIDLLVDVARDALAGKPLPEPIPLDGSGAFERWLRPEILVDANQETLHTEETNRRFVKATKKAKE